MKSRKALKRLDKAEELLSDILERYGAIQKQPRETLESARNLVVRAKKSLTIDAGLASGKDPVAPGAALSAMLLQKPAAKASIARANAKIARRTAAAHE